MDVWALADLHLSFGVPEKTMEVFGAQWERYAQKIELHWREVVQPEDMVLIAGDISWALALEDAHIDLEWIDALPGIKVLIKGNHDYWWSSLSKVKKILPPSLNLIQNNSFFYQGVAVGGARLWDTEEFNFGHFFQHSREKLPEEELKNQKKIYQRELERLELSLKELNPKAEVKIAMTHYPPLGAELKSSKVTELLERYGVDICIFGHLHNLTKEQLTFGKRGRVIYYLTSCDYLDFKPLKIYSSAK
jgi:uncharacterized protein